ncbi:hypothetical protein [Vibrio tasmaniensis]|uniref:hypothetical protein n=1 Tax=Vibrio tasmaniensis TaxID=212663 RepID=UPI00107FA73D|nr:hypothetical protein [Vibrio tasmaniensis]
MQQEKKTRDFIDNIVLYFTNVEQCRSYSRFDNWDKSFKYWKGDTTTFIMEFNGENYDVEFNVTTHRGEGNATISISQQVISDASPFPQLVASLPLRNYYRFDLNDFGDNHKMFCQVAHKVIVCNYRQGNAVDDIYYEVEERANDLVEIIKTYRDQIEINVARDAYEDFELECIKMELKTLVAIDNWKAEGLTNIVHDAFCEKAFEEAKNNAMSNHPFYTGNRW